MSAASSLATELVALSACQSSYLGDVVDILDSKRKPITKRDRVAGPYPYYGATGVLDWVSGFIFDEPLVLIGEDGAKWGAGDRSAFAVNGKSWVNNHAHVLRPNRQIVTDEWLIYYLNATDLTEFVSGMTVPKLNQGRLREIPIPTPPVEEQKRIVAVLDQAFAALDRARALAKANLADAEELFPSVIAEIFSASENWRTCTISDVGAVFDGPHATPKTVDDGPLFLGISSLLDGRIALEKTRHVTEEDFIKWTRRVTPRAGDVVFSYETRLGQVGLIPEGMRCCLGRRMGLVRLNTSIVLPEYFIAYYLSPYFQSFLRDKTVLGATVDRISIKEFPSFPILIPSREKQTEIVSLIENVRKMHDAAVAMVDEKVRDLADLRQSLLQKAFAGELT